MRRFPACAALALAAVLAGGCREKPDKVPAACLTGPGDLRAALTRAPGNVALPGGSKLSECFVKTGAGDLQTVASTWIIVAGELAPRAHLHPDAQAAVELGFMRGALARGAEPGIHDTFRGRFDQELIPVDRSAPAFRRGEAAGRQHG
ncbi:MAG: hypothetical protein QOJ07_1819 [Thermoleophilaceae bacterium]|nr:hypothetical protein [Thermoleophilaceae bacterium]